MCVCENLFMFIYVRIVIITQFKAVDIDFCVLVSNGGRSV